MKTETTANGAQQGTSVCSWSAKFSNFWSSLN